jgi:NitT/TauT family transport system substrate-binding protein
MTVTTRKLLATTLAAASLVALRQPAAAAEKMKLKLILPTAVTTFMLPYLVPKDQGWYEKNGLEVEELFVSGDSTALRTMLSGGGDLTIVGPPTVFKAAIEGAKVKSIGSWQPVVDYRIVAAKPIAAIKELAGKVFASAGPSDLTTELPKMVMKKHGLDYKSLRFIQVGGHPARLQAVAAGKVQATMINTLTSVKGQNEGVINVITKLVDDFPKLGYVMLVANDEDLANPAKRKAMKTFLEGSVMGARFTMEHPDAAAEILAKRAPDMGIDLIKPVVRELNAMKVWGVDGGNDSEVLRFTSTVSAELGMTKREIKLEEVMDNSISDEVIAKIGKM